MITYTDPNGKTYSELPRIWHGTTPVLESWALENGWTKAEIHHYSKLKLCRSLKSAGLWDTVKAAIDASSYADEWSLAQDLASTDAAFSAFMAAMPGVTEEQKTALLAQCEEG